MNHIFYTFLLLFGLFYPAFLLAECPTQCTCITKRPSNLIEVECKGLFLSNLEFITQLPDPKSISKLDLTNNNISYIPKTVLDKFYSLQELILDNNLIEYLDADSFVKLGNLSKFSASRNKIQRLPVGLFRENEALRKLDLSYNKIQRLSSENFKYLSDLQQLKIDHNFLTCIESKAFSNLNKLEILLLDNNNLTTLFEDNFKQIVPYTLMKKFSAHNNIFLCDCNLKWFPNWLKIRERFGDLILAHEMICYTANGDPISIRNSENFSCATDHAPIDDSSENQMDEPDGGLEFATTPAEVSSEAYCPSERICPEKCQCANQRIDCSSQGLTSIPFNIPADTTELVLSSNRISHVPDYAFAHLSVLRKLDICNNELVEISPKAFSGLGKLGQLTLYNNKLTNLDSKLFEGLEKMSILLLNANHLGCLRKDVFKNLKNLKLLSLFQNQIRSIENGTLENLQTSTTVHLGNNPLICDCNLAWIKTMNGNEKSMATCDWPARVKNRPIAALTADKFTCEGGEKERTADAGSCFIDLPCPSQCTCTPDARVICANAGLTSVPPNIPKYTVHLDLSHNKITKILADGSFKDLPDLKTVILSHNKIDKIEPGAFKGAANVTTLNLESNEIESIEEKVLQDLVSLKTLELRENFIKCVRNTTFSGLTKLTSLSLAENTIKTIERNSFHGLPLGTLNLLGNHLVCNCHMKWFNQWLNEAAQSIVNGYPRCQEPSTLKELPIADLFHKDLDCSETDYNSCADNIKCPDGCSCEKTSVVCKGSFISVPQDIPIETTSLAITGSLLSNFRPEDFSYLYHLKTLDLTHNMIDRIIPAKKNLKPLENLEILKLDYNYFKCIPENSFDFFPNLKDVSLSNNVISHVPHEAFENLRSIEKIVLVGNTLYCDCSLSWLSSGNMKAKLKTINATCSQPKRMENKAISQLSQSDFTCMENEPPVSILAKCNECLLEPCQHGTCSLVEEVDHSYKCNCDPNYQGRFCEEVIDYCFNNPCQNGGECTAYNDKKKYECSCADGFEGPNCEINVDDCKNNQCLNGGECIDLVNDYSCECPLGYEGDFCEVDVDICQYGLNPCQNGATCVDLGSDYTCECQKGFEGKNCERKTDYCVNKAGYAICKNDALCESTTEGFKCFCQDGYTGVYCETKNFDNFPKKENGVQMDSICTSTTCLNGGKCFENSGSTVCRCNPGFSGEKCETNIGSLILAKKEASAEFKLTLLANMNFTFMGQSNSDGALLSVSANSDGATGLLHIKFEKKKVSVIFLMNQKDVKCQITTDEFLDESGNFYFTVIANARQIFIYSHKNLEKVYECQFQSQELVSLNIASAVLGATPVQLSTNAQKLVSKDSYTGCLKSFYFNTNRFYFDTTEINDSVKRGECSVDFEDSDEEFPATQALNSDLQEECGVQKYQTVYHKGCASIREYNIVASCPKECSERDTRKKMCCKVSRFREYAIKFQCPDGARTDPINVKVNKKCDCVEC